jgi:hypothetical protein
LESLRLLDAVPEALATTLAEPLLTREHSALLFVGKGCYEMA